MFLEESSGRNFEVADLSLENGLCSTGKHTKTYLRSSESEYIRIKVNLFNIWKIEYFMHLLFTAPLPFLNLIVCFAIMFIFIAMCSKVKLQN